MPWEREEKKKRKGEKNSIHNNNHNNRQQHITRSSSLEVIIIIFSLSLSISVFLSSCNNIKTTTTKLIDNSIEKREWNLALAIYRERERKKRERRQNTYITNNIRTNYIILILYHPRLVKYIYRERNAHRMVTTHTYI